MAKLSTHWTEASTDNFLYRIAADYVRQIEQAMTATGTTQTKMATKLGVSEGRVSQVLNSPGNLTLRKIIEYARALGKKVAIVAYDDGDFDNKNGPVNAEIFTACWERFGRPSDFFSLNSLHTTTSTDARSATFPETVRLDHLDNEALTGSETKERYFYGGSNANYLHA